MYICALFALRLKESDELNHDYFGHCNVLCEMGFSSMIQGTELVLKLNFSKTFRTRFPFRKEWSAHSVVKNHVISVSQMLQRLKLAPDGIWCRKQTATIHLRRSLIC